MPPTLTNVRALKDGRLKLTWVASGSVVVDLSQDIARLHYLAPLRKADMFRRVRLGEGGHAVVWPGDIDIGADSLWRDTLLARGDAGAVAFNDWRMRHGLSLAAAAEALGLSRRMVAYYSAADKPVPKTVQLACEGWESRRSRHAA
jgi:hypothetical protein